MKTTPCHECGKDKMCYEIKLDEVFKTLCATCYGAALKFKMIQGQIKQGSRQQGRRDGFHPSEDLAAVESDPKAGSPLEPK